MDKLNYFSYEYLYVVVRLEDGRLLDYLVAHDELMEEQVAFFIREILEALQHLHTCRVAHLDLKVGTHWFYNETPLQ